MEAARILAVKRAELMSVYCASSVKLQT